MSPLVVCAASVIYVVLLIFVAPVRKFSLAAAAFIGGYVWLMYREATKNTETRKQKRDYLAHKPIPKHVNMTSQQYEALRQQAGDAAPVPVGCVPEPAPEPKSKFGTLFKRKKYKETTPKPTPKQGTSQAQEITTGTPAELDKELATSKPLPAAVKMALFAFWFLVAVNGQEHGQEWYPPGSAQLQPFFANMSCPAGSETITQLGCMVPYVSVRCAEGGTITLIGVLADYTGPLRPDYRACQGQSLTQLFTRVYAYGECPSPQAVICSPCRHGSFNPTSGSRLYLSGSSSLTYGFRACATCPSGFTSTANSSNCTVECPIGYYGLYGGCMRCVQPFPDIVVTTAGKASTSSQQCIFQSCPLGHVSAPPTTSQKFIGCEDCGPGTYQPEINSKCIPCPAGTYSTIMINNRTVNYPYRYHGCSMCADGTFSDEGATACSNCPFNHISTINRTMCVPCDTNYIAVGTQCVLCTSYCALCKQYPQCTVKKADAGTSTNSASASLRISMFSCLLILLLVEQIGVTTAQV